MRRQVTAIVGSILWSSVVVAVAAEGVFGKPEVKFSALTYNQTKPENIKNIAANGRAIAVHTHPHATPPARPSPALTHNQSNKVCNLAHPSVCDDWELFFR
jgi:hypothetical protein